MTQFSWSFLRACFIAGAVCAAVAYLVTPQLWWIGLVAGFAVGYLGYEFRETLRASGHVLRTSRMATAQFMRTVADLIRTEDAPTKMVAVFALALAATITATLVWTTHDRLGHTLGYWSVMSLCIPVFGLFLGFVLSVPTSGLMRLGAKVAAREYWLEETRHGIWEFGGTSDFKEAEEKGLALKPLNYANTIRWTLLGIGVVIWFCLFCWWYWTITKGVPEALKLGWDVVKIIHSHERVLCGIDGAIGGGIAYFLFKILITDTGVTSPLVSELMVTVLGGLLGMVVGTLHWRFARVIIRS